ncbi:MAG: class I SAM-dependent methyltransferase [Chloroflexi bacterium]|nr:class I SAM-dependent methyltransferase [Chloroflexota bacterium]
MRGLNLLRRYWAGELGSRNPILLANAARLDRERIAMLARVSGWREDEARAVIREIEHDAAFLDPLREGLSAGTDYRPQQADFRLFNRWGSMFFFPVALYALVRLLRPEVVVETGGTPGKSSAFILRALARNDSGRLITIDLPPRPTAADVPVAAGKFHESLPPGQGAGWIVPAALKSRQALKLGKSVDLLLPALDEAGGADLFIHDSDHSYENMLWEFETVWPRLRSGGVLFSDDIISNSAFDDFCRGRGLNCERLVNVGMIRKR